MRDGLNALSNSSKTKCVRLYRACRKKSEQSCSRGRDLWWSFVRNKKQKTSRKCRENAQNLDNKNMFTPSLRLNLFEGGGRVGAKSKSPSMRPPKRNKCSTPSTMYKENSDTLICCPLRLQNRWSDQADNRKSKNPQAKALEKEESVRYEHSRSS